MTQEAFFSEEAGKWYPYRNVGVVEYFDTEAEAAARSREILAAMLQIAEGVQTAAESDVSERIAVAEAMKKVAAI